MVHHAEVITVKMVVLAGWILTSNLTALAKIPITAKDAKLFLRASKDRALMTENVSVKNADAMSDGVEHFARRQSWSKRRNSMEAAIW